jgi:hypothetical protein
VRLALLSVAMRLWARVGPTVALEERPAGADFAE